MTAKVYSPPEGFPEPEFKPWETYQERVQEYTSKLKAWIMKNGKGKYRGEIVRFGVADGHAEYFVFSLSPLALIHNPVNDAYHFPYIDRLTSADIKHQVETQKAWERMVAIGREQKD